VASSCLFNAQRVGLVLKLLLRQSGESDRLVQVDGDTAILGRNPHCDVVIPQPYVSNRHLKILRGIVAVDLGSSNGSYIGSERLSEPALVRDKVTLGQGELTVEVLFPAPEEASVAQPRPATAPQPDPSALQGELEELRVRIRTLEAQLRKLQGG
jgi:pSer/pThr/pTyr-binding forkhead associated (FHA) protein